MRLALGNVRHRLTLSYLAAFTLILLLFISGAAFLQYAQLTRQMEHAEIQDLETAEGLLYFAPSGQLFFNQQYHNRPQSRLLSDRYMEVLTLDGRILLRNDRLGQNTLGGVPLIDEGAASYDERTLTLDDGTNLLVISHVHSIGNIPLIIRVGYSLSSVWLRVREFSLLLLSALPFALLLAGLFGYRMATQVLRPLNEMASQVKTMTASKLSERLQVNNPEDELGNMASVINELLHRLEDSFENLKRFTADASHELRTPLASIRSVGEVALQHDRSPEEYRDAIGSMLEEGTRLTETVDALLSMSRADAGRIAIERSTINAFGLVSEACALFEPLADEKGQQLEICGDQTLCIHADQILVQRAITNVLENAIKYAPAHTRITIRIQPDQAREDRFTKITIHDTGAPIDASVRLKIFERFFRVDSSRSREAGGNGLGLSIAKWAVEANEGTISLTNENNAGNTFTIRLPSGAEAV